MQDSLGRRELFLQAYGPVSVWADAFLKKGRYMKSAFTLRILLLSLLLCTTWSLSRAYDFAKNGLYYSITDAEHRYIEVSQHSDYLTLTEIEVPETVTFLGETYTVTGIGDQAFSDCSTLSSLSLPQTIQSIGDKAFFQCSSLHSIALPESLRRVGAYSFHKGGFTTLRLPASLIQAGRYAFTHLQDLVSFEVDGNNPCFSAENGVLYNKDKTKLIQYPMARTAPTFSVPSTVTEIGLYAFDACSNLTRVSLPGSLTKIAECAFWDCTNLREVYIPNSVTEIGGSAFQGCI